MQGATWRDKGATGHDEDNGKRIESPSATVCPCRSLQKMDFRGLFSNPGPPRRHSRDVTSTYDVTLIQQRIRFLGFLSN